MSHFRMQSTSQLTESRLSASISSSARRLSTLVVRRERILLLLILLVALTVRLYRLNDVPPGLTHDEAGNGKSAEGVLLGERPLYFTIGNGREPLYAYSMVPLVALLGPTETVVRLTSVLWGLALLLVTWVWVRAAFGPATALLTAAGLAVGFWPLMISRLGLRAVTLPVLLMAAFYHLWRAMGLQKEPAPAATPAEALPRYALAGTLLGASFYSYMASRVMPAVLLLFLGYLALMHPRRARSTWHGIVFVVLVAVLLSVPLFRFLSAHPGAETRIDQLAEPWRQVLAGNWAPLRENVVAALQIFTVDGAGDPHWIYNISGRPLLDPLSGLLFFGGLLLTLWHWRDPAHFFSLLWLVVGMVPVLVTGANSSFVRAVAIQPVVFLMQALALQAFSSWLGCRLSAVARIPVPRFVRTRVSDIVQALIPGTLLLIIAATTTHTYFVRWPNEPDVRVAYHTTLIETARYLDAQPEGGIAVISSIYPGYFHDPYSFDLASHRDDLSSHWFDGRFALLFPHVDEAYAVFSALAPLDPVIEPYFASHARLVDRVMLRADDLIPWFEVYRWQSSAAVHGLSLTTSVDVGHVVDFVGHQLRTPAVAPGGTVELLTFWRVRDGVFENDAQELVLFTHVLDAARQIAGQQDRLDVPAWNWSPGDIFIQLHRFSLRADLEEGFYPLEIGVYIRAEGYPRLPVYDAEHPSRIADSISLPPVEVRVP